LPIIKADITRIRQILLNLVSNATKFTDQGTIIIEAKVDQKPNNQNKPQHQNQQNNKPQVQNNQQKQLISKTQALIQNKSNSNQPKIQIKQPQQNNKPQTRVPNPVSIREEIRNIIRQEIKNSKK
jgi:hypothetical protein